MKHHTISSWWMIPRIVLLLIVILSILVRSSLALVSIHYNKNDNRNSHHHHNGQRSYVNHHTNLPLFSDHHHHHHRSSSSITTSMMMIPMSHTIDINNYKNNVIISSRMNDYQQKQQQQQQQRDKIVTRTTTSLLMSKQQQQPLKSDESLSSKFITTPIFLVVWIILVAWSTSDMAPGQMNSESDINIIMEFINNPVNPQNLNPLFIYIFNIFAPLPILASTMIIPNSSRTSTGIKSSIPYVMLSTFIGFFALGPFLSIRQPNDGDNAIEQQPSYSWYTQNIIENKIFAWLLVLFYIYLPFGTNLVSAISNSDGGFLPILQDYIVLFQSSRLVHVSTLDLLLCYITVTYYMIPIDYQLRNNQNNDDDDNINRVPAFTPLFAGLFPFVGTAIYCALRPPLILPSEEE